MLRKGYVFNIFEQIYFVKWNIAPNKNLESDFRIFMVYFIPGFGKFLRFFLHPLF